MDERLKRVYESNIFKQATAVYHRLTKSIHGIRSSEEKSPKQKSPNIPKKSADISVLLTKSGRKLEPVLVNVYNLTKVNQTVLYTGLGVYHSGVQVYNREFGYGGHSYPQSGIYQMREPKDLSSLSSIEGCFKFLQTIHIGYTEFRLDDIYSLIAKMGATEWRGDQYHLLYHNCNNFSNQLCIELCGRTIPGWINRIASTASLFPFIINFIPKDYLTPPALERKITKCLAIKSKGQVNSIKEQSSKSSTAKHESVPVRKSTLDFTNLVIPKEKIDIDKLDSMINEELIKRIEKESLPDNNNQLVSANQTISEQSKQQQSSTTQQTPPPPNTTANSVVSGSKESQVSFAQLHLSNMYSLSQKLNKTQKEKQNFT